jgi:hypothetical protein
VSEDSFELDLAAAELRAGARDADALVGGLAAWLENSVPDLVEVQRKRAGLFDSRKRVAAITCRVGDDTYILESDGRATSARRARTVRGITLKNETLELGPWLRQLSEALLAQAQLSQSSMTALRELLG